MPKQLINAVKILKIVKELQKIKDIVKCPICLEIVKEPLQAGCSHIFCSNCFKKYETHTIKGKDCFCPVCKNLIQRSKKRQNDRVNKVAEYVDKVGGILSKVTNCDVFEVSEEQLQQNLKSKVTPNSRKGKRFATTPKRTSTPKKAKFTTTNDLNATVTKKVTKLEQEETKSPARKCQRRPSKKISGVSTNASEKENITPKKDPFDLLLESSNILPHSTLKSKVIRTYSAKPKTDRKHVYVDKVVEFQDNTNKTRILQWLNDTRNKFDNITLTQTQNENHDCDSNSITSFDLPSVSQAHKKKRSKVNNTTLKHAATQQLRKNDNKKNLKNRRAASLDRYVIRKVYPKHRLKRHSVACESQEYDNMIIEIVDSDNECSGKENTKKLWNLLEEESLKDIEKNTTKRGRPKLNKSKKDPNTTVTQKSQWDNLKSIGKRGRKMKKLNVSQCNSSITPESKKEDKRNVTKDITIDSKQLQKADTNFKKPTVDEVEIVENNNMNEKKVNKSPQNKIYDLDTVEAYFAKTLIKSDENNKLERVDYSDLKSNNTNISTKQNLKPFKNTNCVLKSVENINNKKSNPAKCSDIKRKLNYSNKSLIIEKVTVQDKYDININEGNDLVEIQKVVEQEEFKGFNKIDYNACSEKVNDEDVFKPTQVYLETFKNLDEPELNENLNRLVKKLFNEIEFQKQSQSNINIDVFEPILTAMKFLVEKMEQRNKQQPKKEFTDVQTQTNNLVFCNSSVQTSVKLEDVLVQTDPMDGFYISSNESFKTPAKVHVEIQTECLPESIKRNEEYMKVLPPPDEFRRTLTNENGSSSYQFTESLDNINFETQDILNQNQSKLSQPLHKFVFKSQNKNNRFSSKNSTVLSANFDKGDIKKGGKVDINQLCNNVPSQLAPSAESQKCLFISANSQQQSPSPSSRRALNQVFNKMNVDKNVFKRLRRPESDSDSDSEIHANPKKICNKFLNNDLSLKFESQCDDLVNNEKQNAVRNEILSCDSDKIDYEEFLEKVLKKYEDPSPNVKSVPSNQNIIERCEKIIREATMLRPQEIVQNSSYPKTEQINKLSLNTMQEFNQEFNYIKSNQTNSDEVHTKNLNNANVNPFSLSLFGNSEEHAVSNQHVNKFNNSSNRTVNQKELDDYVKEISNEFEKSFDENVNAELADIHECVKNKSLKQQNITILQDIKLNNVKKPETEDIAIENFDDSFDNVDIVSHKSDDMFDDADIVEGTPQKNKKYSNNRNIPFDEPILMPESNQPLTIDEDVINCLNMTFTPPPGFQDSENPDDETLKYNNQLNKPKTNSNEPEIKKFIYGISSLTPDLILEQNPPLKRLEQLPDTSTPNMLEESNLPLIPLSLSPIKPSQSKFITGPLNPIDIAKSSKFSPLMIVKSKGPPQRVLTPQSSTPKQKSILNYVKQDNLDASPSPGCSRYSTPVEEIATTNPCVSCTRLTTEQVKAITSLATKKLLCYTASFSNSVTHMIVVTDARGCVKDHTMKYVSAVAAGIWVLSFNWIEECLKMKRLVPEEPFEVKDVSGLPGPRQSRLTHKRDLLKGLKIHVAKPFVSTTAEQVEDVVTMLGGKVVPRPDDLLSRNGYIPLIITEARASQDFELYETWLESLRTVTVDLEWLSRSVGQYQLQSLRPFTLCSEDSMCELGYPTALIAEVTTSQSVTTISC